MFWLGTVEPSRKKNKPPFLSGNRGLMAKKLDRVRFEGGK
jgi:hypothetical protein